MSYHFDYVDFSNCDSPSNEGSFPSTLLVETDPVNSMWDDVADTQREEIGLEPSPDHTDPMVITTSLEGNDSRSMFVPLDPETTDVGPWTQGFSNQPMNDMITGDERLDLILRAYSSYRRALLCPQKDECTINPEETLGVPTVNEPDRSEIPSQESAQNGNEVAMSPNPWTDEGNPEHNSVHKEPGSACYRESTLLPNRTRPQDLEDQSDITAEFDANNPELHERLSEVSDSEYFSSDDDAWCPSVHAPERDPKRNGHQEVDQVDSDVDMADIQATERQSQDCEDSPYDLNPTQATLDSDSDLGHTNRSMRKTPQRRRRIIWATSNSGGKVPCMLPNCHQCKVLDNRSSFIWHLEIEHGLRPTKSSVITCQWADGRNANTEKCNNKCGKSFSSFNSFVRHVGTSHMTYMLRPCYRCHRFYRKDMVKRHLLTCRYCPDCHCYMKKSEGAVCRVCTQQK